MRTMKQNLLGMILKIKNKVHLYKAFVALQLLCTTIFVSYWPYYN